MVRRLVLFMIVVSLLAAACSSYAKPLVSADPGALSLALTEGGGVDLRPADCERLLGEWAVEADPGVVHGELAVAAGEEAGGAIPLPPFAISLGPEVVAFSSCRKPRSGQPTDAASRLQAERPARAERRSALRLPGRGCPAASESP